MVTNRTNDYLAAHADMEHEDMTGLRSERARLQRFYGELEARIKALQDKQTVLLTHIQNLEGLIENRTPEHLVSLDSSVA